MIHQELAQRAFDAVKAAYETLSDPDKKETCLNVVNNAKKSLEEDIQQKRKDMRSKHKTVIIPEDEPQVYKQELHKRAVKVFVYSLVYCTWSSVLYFSCLQIWRGYGLK